jgi:pSer/pThr/pTyr-binding forkhead associated (FHA) protein
MVQLNVLSGKQAGAVAVVHHFPFLVGRDPAAHLRLEEDGIWDRHLELDLQIPEGFLLKVHSRARATVNDQPVEKTLLRNGDLIAIGPVRIRFWLGKTRQSSLRTREFLTWAALAALCIGQVVLIYRLLH